MSSFGINYSRYYNLLYKDKDYKGEVDYINKIIEKYSKRVCKSILDVGCGTGKHLKFFKDIGYFVCGIDLSENMIVEAKKYLSQTADLYCAKASDFNINKKFDIIVSLFHVMNYQTENSELEKIYKNVYNHLEDGGLFIFDFWYGPAVLTDLPTVKIKRLEDNENKIIRITEPVIHTGFNTVDVHFEIIIEDKNTHVMEITNELHKMRYFFLPEIDYFLYNARLKRIVALEWMTYKDLSSNSWYGLVVVSK